MKLHTFGNGPGDPPCPWCGLPWLAYQFHGGGGDVYRCMSCMRDTVHLQGSNNGTRKKCGLRKAGGFKGRIAFGACQAAAKEAVAHG